MFLYLLFVCCFFSLNAMHNKRVHALPVFGSEPDPLYEETNKHFLGNGLSNVATLLVAKNTLCVARADAQLGLYDTNDFKNHSVVETPVHAYTCRNMFKPLPSDIKAIHKQCVEGNKHTQEQYYDFYDVTYSETLFGRKLIMPKHPHPRCAECMFQAPRTSSDVFKERVWDTPIVDSHTNNMQPSSITSNEMGNIVCLAKKSDDCSALELYTLSGKNTDTLTLKNTIPCDGHMSIITDVAYTPHHTCVSISNDSIKEWDVLTGKATHISTVMTLINPTTGKYKELLHFKVSYGQTGRLLPIGSTIFVSASHNSSFSYGRYIAMVDMRTKHMLCNQMTMKTLRVYDMAQSPSNYCFLTGGDEQREAHVNVIKEWDWRKIGDPVGGNTDPQPVRQFYIEENNSCLSFFPTIRTLASHNNSIIAAVTEQNKEKENGTFVHIWDTTTYKTSNQSVYPARNLPLQTIKISDAVEPNVHISTQADRVFVMASGILTELTSISS